MPEVPRQPGRAVHLRARAGAHGRLHGVPHAARLFEPAHAHAQPGAVRVPGMPLEPARCRLRLPSAPLGGVPPAFHDLRSPRFQNCTVVPPESARLLRGSGATEMKYLLALLLIATAWAQAPDGQAQQAKPDETATQAPAKADDASRGSAERRRRSRSNGSPARSISAIASEPTSWAAWIPTAAWWTCPQGPEYSASVSPSRTRKNGCSTASMRAATTGATPTTPRTWTPSSAGSTTSASIIGTSLTSTRCPRSPTRLRRPVSTSNRSTYAAET